MLKCSKTVYVKELIDLSCPLKILPLQNEEEPKLVLLQLLQMKATQKNGYQFCYFDVEYRNENAYRCPWGGADG